MAEGLQLSRVKRIALAEVAGLVSAPEPAGALRGCSVREGIGDDITTRTVLKSVIAYRAGGADRFFDVPGFDNMLDPVGVTRPNTGQKICLQFEPDRELIVFSFANPTARRLYAIGYAQQILHVMSHFVRDDVRFSEIASGAEPVFELMEKT